MDESEEFSSESEWDATVGRSSGSPAIDNQARYVTEGDTVVAKPLRKEKEKGGKTSAVPVKAPDTSHVRHVDSCSSGSGRFQSMESNSHCDGQVCRYELVFLRAPCSW